MANNLYDNQVYFKLIIDDKPFYINEPVGWAELAVSSIRDPDFFGAVYEFIDADLNIGFSADDVAYDLVKNVIDTKGQDGPILFEFGLIIDQVEIKQFYGNVNLNTYVDKDNVITAAIEKVDFESLYRTRFETDITLSATLSLDNLAITPDAPTSVKLHSKKISKLFKSQVVDPISYTTDPAIARFMFMTHDTSNALTDEVTTNEALSLGISGINPMDDDLYGFSVDEAGTYDITIVTAFFLTIRRADIGHVGNYDVRPRFRVRRGGAVVVDILYDQGRFNGTVDFFQISSNISYTTNWNGELQVNDQLFFTYEGVQEHAGSPYIYSADNYTSTVTIMAQTIAPATQCRMYTLYQAINKMLESATGRANALKSSYLSPTGCGGLYYITNGYQIRNFDVDDKPIIYNLKRALTTASGVEGLGVGITNIAGLDYLVIEPLSYFFQNKEILKIISFTPPTLDSRDEFEYSEENAKEFVFNEYEIGYNKYSTEELNTLDEFNTYQTGLFPIKSYKAKFSKKVDDITSGYSIEVQRREQFKSNPSESLTNDDDIFLISCIAGPSGIEAERNQNFTNITNLYSPETAYNLRLRPKRMIYNWAPFLNIGLWAKGGTDVIKNTFVKNNGALSVEMTGECMRYGPAGIAVENADILVSDFKGANRTRFHLPIYANFKSPLRYDDAIKLKNASIAQDNVENSYGYIVHPDDKGNYWKSYVYSFKYNPTTEVAEFKVAKIEKYTGAGGTHI